MQPKESRQREPCGFTEDVEYSDSDELREVHRGYPDGASELPPNYEELDRSAV